MFCSWPVTFGHPGTNAALTAKSHVTSCGVCCGIGMIGADGTATAAAKGGTAGFITVCGMFCVCDTDCDTALLIGGAICVGTVAAIVDGPIIIAFHRMSCAAWRTSRPMQASVDACEDRSPPINIFVPMRGLGSDCPVPMTARPDATSRPDLLGAWTRWSKKRRGLPKSGPDIADIFHTPSNNRVCLAKP